MTQIKYTTTSQKEKNISYAEHCQIAILKKDVL